MPLIEQAGSALYFAQASEITLIGTNPVAVSSIFASPVVLRFVGSFRRSTQASAGVAGFTSGAILKPISTAVFLYFYRAASSPPQRSAPLA